VIRFYGYDDNGQLVRGGIRKPVNQVINPGQDINSPTTGDAFIEKWYLFAISNLKFKVAGKLTEYSIEATVSHNYIANGNDRGTIPYNLSLNGKTLKEALAGPLELTTIPPSNATREAPSNTPSSPGEADQNLANQQVAASAPPKADAAPSKQVVKSGLMAALTKYQQDLVNAGTFTYGDIYEVEFINASLENARVRRAGTPDKTRTAPASGLRAQLELQERQRVNYDQQLIDLVAGRSITQVLDELVRNSSYIEDQQLAKVDATTGKIEPKTDAAGSNVAWFKISMVATPLQWDAKRNDYAYRIKYQISAYKINDANSDWFPRATFNGVHKQYNYWFTGQNTSVLAYEQNINTLYRRVLSGSPYDGRQFNNNRDMVTQYVAKTNSAENSQGANGKVNEPAANLADYLYSPEDQARATLQIIGDPAWLQQGEAAIGRPKGQWNFSAFDPDGSINFDSQEALFEVLFDVPGDYNLSTGLIDPRTTTLGGTTTEKLASVPLPSAAGTNTVPGRKARQSFIYKATTVTSDFNKGKFTQTLNGSAISFYARDIISDQAANKAQAQRDATRAASTTRTSNADQSSPAAAMVQYATADLNPGQSDQDLANQTFEQNLLGSVPTRPQPEAGAPTSNADLTTTPTNNNIDPNDIAAGNPPPQQIAPPDDYIG
jgi:hypothetical protein